MEPMALGSAPSSPSSNVTFLPNFLLGDNRTAINTSVNHLEVDYNKISSTPDTRSEMISRSFINRSEIGTFSSPINCGKQGPPNIGLFDSFEVLKTRIGEKPSFGYQSKPTDDSSNSIRLLSNISNLDGVSSYWVTVFGFPPNCIHLVCAELSSCGTIVDKKGPQNGNWMHIRFSNKSDVVKALALNGKCINNSIMIGVQLHHDSCNNGDITLNTVNDACNKSVARARSLAHSFTTLEGQDTMFPTQNVPQKSTGIVSKAMEYVFGW